MTDNLLNLLGLARRGGNLAVGEEPVAEACRGRRAKLVLLAADAAENSRRRARRLAQAGGTPLIGLPYTKEELGGQLGRGSCAMAALLDIGLAAAAAQRLAQSDETLSPVARTLAEQARRPGRAPRARKQKIPRA